MISKAWSTSAVEPSSQFAYWRDAVSEAVLNVTPRRWSGNEQFSGEITCRVFEDTRFAAFASSSHEIVRTRSHINRSRGEHYLISVQRRGTGLMSQAERTCELRPGNIGVLDGMRPFTVTFPDEVDRIVAALPYRLLRPRAPWLDAQPLNCVPVTSPLVEVCRLYIELLARDDAIAPQESWVLVDNLCNLLALLTAPDESKRAGLRNVARTVEFDAMTAYLRTNIANPGLSPAVLARHMRVSLRTVHNRFEESGTTFGRWIMENRLAAIHKALSDPRCDGMTVSQIAFNWGFNDISHFTKVFRQRYDLSPGRLRKVRKVSADL